MIIKIDSVWAGRDDRPIFAPISFQLNSGDAFQLVGENGAGKTTLLRGLMGLNATLNGDLHFAVEPHQRFYFGHKPAINDVLTVKENLQWLLSLHQAQWTPACETALQHLKILPLLDVAAEKLSAGQRRRVVLSCLWLLPEVKLWLLDEPLTALDVNGVQMVVQQMEALRKVGAAIMFTSHQELNLNNMQQLQLVPMRRKR